jgi:anaerobic selenocysteine-containing dehydrogenase
MSSTKSAPVNRRDFLKSAAAGAAALAAAPVTAARAQAPERSLP